MSEKPSAVAKEPEEQRMSFLEHLEELRRRIFRAALAIIAGIVIGWNYKAQLLGWMLRPLEIAWYCRGRTCKPTQIFTWMLHPWRFTQMRLMTGQPAGATL